MIDNPTCFILGAGASFDAGLPVGRGLRDMICKDLVHNDLYSDSAPESSIWRMLRENQFDRDHMKEFGRRLLDAGPPSVDFFIEANREFMDLGKAAIAAAIMRLEDPGKLLYNRKPTRPEQDPDEFGYTSSGWYQSLWEGMLRGCETDAKVFLASNKVSFITFNYDRSLEHFLAIRFKSMFNGASEELFRTFPIVHVHGSVGLYENTGGQGAHRAYRPGFDRHSVRTYAEKLHLAPEEIPEAVSEQVKNALSAKKRLCFMGFGYDPTNLSKIPFHGRYDLVVLGMTGLRPAERERTREDMRARMPAVKDSAWRACNREEYCEEILSDYVL